MTVKKIVPKTQASADLTQVALEAAFGYSRISYHLLSMVKTILEVAPHAETKNGKPLEITVCVAHKTLAWYDDAEKGRLEDALNTMVRLEYASANSTSKDKASPPILNLVHEAELRSRFSDADLIKDHLVVFTPYLVFEQLTAAYASPSKALRVVTKYYSSLLYDEYYRTRKITEHSQQASLSVVFPTVEEACVVDIREREMFEDTTPTILPDDEPPTRQEMAERCNNIQFTFPLHTIGIDENRSAVADTPIYAELDNPSGRDGAAVACTLRLFPDTYRINEEGEGAANYRFHEGFRSVEFQFALIDFCEKVRAAEFTIRSLLGSSFAIHENTVEEQVCKVEDLVITLGPDSFSE